MCTTSIPPPPPQKYKIKYEVGIHSEIISSKKNNLTKPIPNTNRSLLEYSHTFPNSDYTFTQF